MIELGDSLIRFHFVQWLLVIIWVEARTEVIPEKNFMERERKEIKLELRYGRMGWDGMDKIGYQVCRLVTHCRVIRIMNACCAACCKTYYMYRL